MKKTISLLLAFILVLSLGTTTAFATPFDDDDVIIDLPSVNTGETVDINNQFNDFYEVAQDNTEPKDDGNNSSAGSNTVATNNLETATTGVMSGDAAENAPGNFDRFDNNTFDGKPTQFEGSNGSVTSVYPDGSVITENKDGSKQGVSGSGCPMTVDKDGTETYQLEDGSIGKKYADGRKEHIYPDGSKLIQNADGSLSTYEPTGYFTDLDDEGNVKSVYFENGQRIDFYDKDGNIVKGDQTITGPNGEKVSFTYKEDENGNVTDFAINAEGNGINNGFTASGDGEGNYNISINSADGSNFNGSFTNGEANEAHFTSGDGECESHYKRDGNQVSFNYRDENGEGSVSEITTDGGTTTTVKNADGSTATVKTDSDGNVISGEVKSKDGSTLKVNDDGSTEIYDNETGLKITMKDGSVQDAHIPLKDGSSYDFDGDTGILVDKSTGNKVVWTHDENGNVVIKSPNKGEYTVDENGNLFYNGEPVSFDGKQVNVDTGFNTESTTAETTTQAPDLIEQVCGTYEMTGTAVLTTDKATFSDTGTQEQSVYYTVTVSDAGSGNINVNVKRDDFEFSAVAALDEASKTAVFDYETSSDFGSMTWNCTLTFDVSGNSVNGNLKIILSGLSEINVSGPKS